jgi:DNA invertase Pin-like site-specific DNA recombinase
VYKQGVAVRLVGYPRVSTRGQVKTGASIPYQDREIRAWARRNGHRIVGMFPEEGRSGALDLEDRVALTAAIDMIAGGKAEGLVCYSLDRLAREITVQEAILAKIWEEVGGRVFTTDQGEVLRDDPDDPMRTAMRKMAGVMYELDRRLVVARLRRGRRLKAERGGFAGGGVRYGFTTERKQLVPDRPSGKSPATSADCTGAACRSERSPTSSMLSRSQPNAAAPGTRQLSPGSFGGQHEHLLAGRAAGCPVGGGQPHAPARPVVTPRVGGRGVRPQRRAAKAPQDGPGPLALLGCHVIGAVDTWARAAPQAVEVGRCTPRPPPEGAEWGLANAGANERPGERRPAAYG